MAKQEKIQEWIDEYLTNQFIGDTKDYPPECASETKAILKYLKSEGMVLKVDTKLPPIDNSKGEWKTGLEYKQDIEKMNLTAYEELI